MTLTEFLLARISDDEDDARLAMQGFTTGTWTLDGGIWAGHETEDVVDWAYQETRQHIARWDPARVLAECAAKRQTIGLYRGKTGANDSYVRGWHEATHAVMLALATPYASHPDFNIAWAS